MSEAQQTQQITVDLQTFFKMQILQYDADIANAEQKVSELKSAKAKYILDHSLKVLKDNQATPQKQKSQDNKTEENISQKDKETKDKKEA